MTLPEATEGYRCRYGLNPALRSLLEAGSLRVSAEDSAGEVRAVELAEHPFLVATLFQPERAALLGRLPPLALAFVRAAMDDRQGLAALVNNSLMRMMALPQNSAAGRLCFEQLPLRTKRIIIAVPLL